MQKQPMQAIQAVSWSMRPDVRPREKIAPDTSMLIWSEEMPIDMWRGQMTWITRTAESLETLEVSSYHTSGKVWSENHFTSQYDSTGRWVDWKKQQKNDETSEEKFEKLGR